MILQLQPQRGNARQGIEPEPGLLRLFPLDDFGTAVFNGCSAIQNAIANTTLYGITMQDAKSPPNLMASLSPITMDLNGWNHFSVAWHAGA